MIIFDSVLTIRIRSVHLKVKYNRFEFQLIRIMIIFDSDLSQQNSILIRNLESFPGIMRILYDSDIYHSSVQFMWHAIPCMHNK